jgi:hypothetical protein
VKRKEKEMDYQLQIGDAKVSLDRLTLIGSGADIFPKVLAHSQYIKNSGEARFPYRYNHYCIDGAVIQTKEKKGLDNVRIDFNPNKVIKEGMLEMLSLVHFSKVTRLDIAVDYYGMDLSGLTWIDTKARKRVTYHSGAGKLETLYMGSGGSEASYRIYDKAKEQKDEAGGLWWRVEAQLRPESMRATSKGNILALKPFEDVRAVTPEYTGLSATEKAMVYWLTHEPNAWGELHSNTRTKYKKLIVEKGTPLSPQPNEIVKRKIGELHHQLAYYTDSMRLTRIS